LLKIKPDLLSLFTKKHTMSLLLVAIIATVKSQTLIKPFVSAESFAQLGTTTFFAADDGAHGVELWKTDGTAAGTIMVKDIAPGAQSSRVTALSAFNGKVYFSASDNINGDELWCSDGTAAGTTMLKDINTAHVGNTGSLPKNRPFYGYSSIDVFPADGFH
jgi:ELWxxDGT repeat protein